MRPNHSPFNFALATFLFLVISLTLTSGTLCGQARPSLKDYLPAGQEYDAAIPKPAATFGFEVGSWHLRPDQIMTYMKTLAAQSPRVSVEVIGRSYERRELLLMAISAPENIARLEEIRKEHLALSDPRTDLNQETIRKMPVIVWMGYSVHGNESSGANAAPLLAYHLAAAQGESVDEYLKNTVILIDPCLNPDGLARFAHWANIHRGRNLVASSAHREHREPWPSGRTNHYWFDLNRDWLLTQHPESRARVRNFHKWRPNVLTDFHEMGTNSTYFFQPGVRSRHNPLTPMENFNLTAKIAEYHAKALDKRGALYFTQERFDDFYYGKGSTYPDVHGAIGILFEQASSRGHVQSSTNGNLSFPFTIKNQFTTSLSTLEAAGVMREELLSYQQRFYSGASKLAKLDPVKAYVFGDRHDPLKVRHMLQILQRHQIVVRRLKTPLEKGAGFRPNWAYIIPANQPQYRLIRSLFERRTIFKDNTFYDVSAWNIADAFNVEWTELSEKEYSPELLGANLGARGIERKSLHRDDLSKAKGGAKNVYAYALDWDSYDAPKAAYMLLSEGLKLKVLQTPIRAQTKTGIRRFDRGTVMVLRGAQNRSPERILRSIRSVAARCRVEIDEISTGLTATGNDLGSPSLSTVKRPKIALLVGGRESAYDAGEAWFILDNRFNMPVALLESESMSSLTNSSFTHLVVTRGRGTLDEAQVLKVQEWVKGGGILVATGAGASWAGRTVLGLKPKARTNRRSAAAPTSSSPTSTEPKRYADRRMNAAKNIIGGAIYAAELDVTHPMGYGYHRPNIAVFKRGTSRLIASPNRLHNFLKYGKRPLLAGYTDEERQKRFIGSTAGAFDRSGRGGVIRLADNPNFRAYWYGTTKLFMNSFFFGSVAAGRGDEEGHGHSDH